MQGFAGVGGAGALRSDLESRASPDMRDDMPAQETIAAPPPPQVYPTYKLLGNLPSSPPQGQVLDAETVRRPSRPTPTTAASDPPSRMPERRLPSDAYSDEPIKVEIQQYSRRDE